MNAKTLTKSADSLTASVMNLPIMKNYNKEDIVVQSAGKLTTGTNTVLGVIKLGIIAAMGYGIWIYVIPPVMTAIGLSLGAVASAFIILGALVIARPLFRWMKRKARDIDKARINADPFATLAEQRVKLEDNKKLFNVSKTGIDNLKSDMQVQAHKSEEEVQRLQTKILSLQSQCQQLKSDMEDRVKREGADYRNSDEFNETNRQMILKLAESARVTQQLEQSKGFIQKYGFRANIMKKLGQKLLMVQTAMEIKLADFDATVVMLKKDFEFSQKANAATTAAKNAMMFNSDWELDYAMGVVTNTIASDIALTAGNLREIDTITSQYSLDSDELYANLELVADKIKTGTDQTPTAKQYDAVDYKPTASDRMNSGNFENLM